MMRVTVEIVPFGQEEDKYTIHTIEIGNMGRHPDAKEGRTVCRYNAWLDGDLIAENMLHAREDGALNLIERALTHRNIEKWLAETEFATKEKGHAKSLEGKAKSNEPASAPKVRRPQRKVAKASTSYEA